MHKFNHILIILLYDLKNMYKIPAMQKILSGKFLTMGKISFISVLLVAAVIFISCSPIVHTDIPVPAPNKTEKDLEINAYGAYLAGRVAHIRKDFDQAADYYKLAYAKDPQNAELIDKLYLLLASKGRIDEAAEYAQKAIDAKTSNSFAYMLSAAKQMHDGQYTDSLKTMSQINDPIYKVFITPLFNAWNYAGLNQQQKALAELEKLKQEKGFASIYRQHRAMLFDYLGQNREAAQAYEQLITDKNAEISVRLLELITNFYIRTGQKDKAVAIMDSTVNNQSLDTLLKSLRLKVAAADPKTAEPILSSAQIGAAEALFTIASTFRYDEVIDIAHMYTALAIYMNPQYNTAKILMADIFEVREMYDDANRLYDSIDKNDIAYYPAQLKKARNLSHQEDFKGAEILLESLSSDYNDIQIYMELGDVLRLSGRFAEAVKYYDRALQMADSPVTMWVLYYAKGVSLERTGHWQEAEETLLKAYDINKHFLVLNHLGYTWMRQNKKINEAFEMIVEAYNQAPFDPSINDSLGFALYNLGYYGMSLKYLEKAAESYPSSAVISAHLGDAYWLTGRKNEARFQWRHALRLKDDSGELDIEATRKKITDGIPEPALSYDKDQIEALIKKIHSPQKAVFKIVRKQ